MAGMKVTTDGAYPAWQPSPKSEIVELMTEVYKDLFNEDPKVTVVHAGFGMLHHPHPLPRHGRVSFGPTFAIASHTQRALQHPLCGKYWRLVLETLKRVPKK